MSSESLIYEISLPSRVYEYEYKDFIKLVSAGNGKEHVRVNFERLTYSTPIANIFLIIKVKEWIRNGQKVEFIYHKKCNAFKYLQRIDFFEHCGITIEEDFIRHDSSGKFVPIKSLQNSNIGQLSTEIAECIAPELSEEMDTTKTGFFDCIEYSVSELGNNTVQHSLCKLSLVNAQYSEYKDFIRVAIVDNGIGIKESFFRTGSPHQVEIETHMDAIHKALESETSSKTHLSSWGESVNAGVGLTLLKSLAEKIDGTFTIFTGNAYYSLNDEELFDESLSFEGTLCCFTFKRSKIIDFHNLLYDTKKDIGLIKETNKAVEALFI